jgi:hypothetical protein
MATEQRTIRQMAEDSKLHVPIEDLSDVTRWFIRIDKHGNRREIFVEETEEEHDDDGVVAYSVAFRYANSNIEHQDTDVRQNIQAKGKEYPVYEKMGPLLAAAVQ